MPSASRTETISIEFWNVPSYITEAQTSETPPLIFEENLMSTQMPTLDCVTMTVVNRRLEVGEVGGMSGAVIRWAFPTLCQSKIFTLKAEKEVSNVLTVSEGTE